MTGSADTLPERLRPGQAIDHFRVIRFLDRGAMGEVYLARDLTLGRKVALKLIPVERLRSPEAVRDFLFEAKATARFNHPNIIAIYAAGEHDGKPYVALEYVEGRSVRNCMEHEPPALMEILRIALAVADALQEAHRHGIVHRDLKPENVLIARDGRIRLLDFGLALPLYDVETGDLDPIRETVDLPPPRPTDRPETVRGTPAYMAPEQWLSEGITDRTDVWALGMMMVELINRQHPHSGMSIIERIRASCLPQANVELASSEPLPEGLRELVARCIRVDPRKRPDAGEVMHALDVMVHRRRHAAGEQAPFPGLLPYSARFADFYFGREEEITEVIERLRETPVLPLVGPSGVGKTSLLEAGVIPRLEEEEGWLVICVRPGAQPFVALAAKLEDHAAAGALLESPSRLAMMLDELAESRGKRVLLVIDPLEEIYTQLEDTEERLRFLEAIALAADDVRDPVRVVFTLRDDFLGRVAESGPAREALNRVMVMRAPNEAALRGMIEKPIGASGYEYESPSLVTDMLASVRGEALALPLLQLCARSLWERRDPERRLIVRSAYDAIGGVGGVLAEHADSVLDGLATDQTRVARGLLIRLVKPDGGRRVIPMSDVLDGLGEEEPVLERFIRARLIAVSEAKLSLSHPSLVEWKQLSGWLEEGRDEHAFLDEVWRAAEDWERHGEREQELWSSHRLEDALVRIGKAATDVPMSAVRFLDAGRRRAEREGRKRRKRWAVIAGIAVVTLGGALGIGSLVREQEHRAQDGLRVAELERDEARRRRAEANRAAGESALLRGDRAEARLRVRRSLELEDSLEARALWRTLATEPLVARREIGGGVGAVAISRDGRKIAVAGVGGIEIVDARSFAVARRGGARERVTAFGFSPDGTRLVSGTRKGELAILELASGRREILDAASGARVEAIAFAPDGSALVAVNRDGTAKVWSTIGEIGEVRATLAFGARPLAVAFSADGRRIAGSTREGAIQVWDAASGAREASWIARAPATALAFAPSGELASGGADGVRMWSANGGEGALLEDRGGPVSALAFIAGGARLIAVGEEGVISEWRVEDRSLERRLDTRAEGGVRVAAIDASGRWIATGGEGALSLWDRERTEVPDDAPSERVRSAAFSPDDRLIATAGGEVVRIWDADTGRALQRWSGHRGAVVAVAFAPDGRRVASASRDRTARVWDLETGEELQLFRHDSAVTGAAFAADGRALITRTTEGRTHRWEWASRTVREGRASPDVAVASPASVSHDGRWVAKIGRNLELVEATTGRRRWRTVLATPRSLLTHRGWSDPVIDASAFVARAREGERTEASATLGAVVFGDRIELWDLASDREIAREVVADVGRVAVHRGGVDYEVNGGAVRRLSATGTVELEGTRIAGVEEEGGAIRVRGDSLLGEGWERRIAGVTAAARDRRGVILGFEDGRIEIDGRSYEGLASLPVARIAVGGELIAAGYPDGRVALWSRRGVLLHRARLYGAISALSIAEGRLTAASELGDALVLDLELLELEYCALMARVWEGSAPSLEHRCAH